MIKEITDEEEAKINDDKNQIIETKDRTSTAEALRIIRTNLEFLLNSKDKNTAKYAFSI